MDNNLVISEPSILIRISKAYSDSLSENELYEYTRGRWKESKNRAEKAKYAFSVYKGVIKEVYLIEKWVPAGSTDSFRNDDVNNELNDASFLKGRFEFIGEKAPEKTRKEYIGKSVAHYFKKGNSNPILYLNI